MAERVTVGYKGTQYDITKFLPQHPGGAKVIQTYLKQGKNITEVFKYPSIKQIPPLPTGRKETVGHGGGRQSGPHQEREDLPQD